MRHLHGDGAIDEQHVILANERNTQRTPMSSARNPVQSTYKPAALCRAHASRRRRSRRLRQARRARRCLAMNYT
jgi:hypothetical protein